MGASLHSIAQGYDGNFTRHLGHLSDGTERSFVLQGLWQIVGIALSIGIGIFAGVVLGLLFMCFGRALSHSEQIFTDNQVYGDSNKRND